MGAQIRKLRGQIRGSWGESDVITRIRGCKMSVPIKLMFIEGPSGAKHRTGVSRGRGCAQEASSPSAADEGTVSPVPLHKVVCGEDMESMSGSDLFSFHWPPRREP